MNTYRELEEIEVLKYFNRLSIIIRIGYITKFNKGYYEGNYYYLLLLLLAYGGVRLARRP